MRFWIRACRPAMWFALSGCMVSGISLSASAQTGPGSSQAAREATDAAAVPILETVEAGRRPLAAGRNVNRIPSRNEAYNQARAAEGRLGVRLGNDMSFRVSD